MKHTVALTAALLFLPFAARAADMAVPEVPAFHRDNADSRAWKRSLLPLIASQSLDAASSWGMREMNPVLADSRGAFGGKAVAVKFGAVGAFVAIEYLVVKKYPRSAREAGGWR